MPAKNYLLYVLVSLFIINCGKTDSTSTPTATFKNGDSVTITTAYPDTECAYTMTFEATYFSVMLSLPTDSGKVDSLQIRVYSENHGESNETFLSGTRNTLKAVVNEIGSSEFVAPEAAIGFTPLDFFTDVKDLELGQTYSVSGRIQILTEAQLTTDILDLWLTMPTQELTFKCNALVSQSS